MSRIHEALKKAAEERLAQVPVESRVEIGDVASEKQLFPVTAAMHVEACKNVDRPEVPGLLRFEDLIKHCAHPKWRVDSQWSVFGDTATSKVGAERFRTLRSRLQQIGTAGHMRRILVTSSLPGEGKTFVSFNLAQSIVRQPERRVLLIDADLRESRLHLVLGAPKTPGLTDYLRGEADEFSVIQNGLGDNLCFIAGGSAVSNPSELLQSERMKKLFELVTPVFDWIILDSPPTIPVHDASALADMCHGVLFVVRAGATSFETAGKAAREFREKNLLGVVFNGAEKGTAYGSYDYGYSGDREPERAK